MLKLDQETFKTKLCKKYWMKYVQIEKVSWIIYKFQLASALEWVLFEIKE